MCEFIIIFAFLYIKHINDYFTLNFLSKHKIKLKDVFKFINGKNRLMDQCKIVGTCKWKYCNICHIDGT
jgi:hypothetical protein